MKVLMENMDMDMMIMKKVDMVEMINMGRKRVERMKNTIMTKAMNMRKMLDMDGEEDYVGED